MADVYIGLGSNIEPEAYLRRALAELTERLGTLECSSVYRSPAHGFRGDDFLNMVVKVDCRLTPLAIESVLSTIEHAGGRPATKRSGPRTMDLDLLLYGRSVDARLRLPREDVLRYSFVLAPLAELAPQLRHPLTGVPVSAAWAAMRETGPILARIGAARSL